MSSKVRLAWVILFVSLAVPAFSSGAKEPAAGGEPITLRYYQWFNQDVNTEIIATDIAEYEKAHPNVKVEAAAITNDAYWDRLILDIASNAEGDIVQLDSTGMHAPYSLRPGGAFVALDSYIKGYVLPDGTNLETDIVGLNLMKRDGKLIALPYDELLFSHIAYRKSFLQEAGVKPEDLVTWQGFLAAAKKLTRDTNGDGKVDRYGYAHPKDSSTLARWWHMQWLWAAGGGVFPKEEPPYTADRLIFNSPQNVYAVQYLKELLDAAGPPGEKGALEEIEMFNNGALSTFMIATWTLGSMESAFVPKEAYATDVTFTTFPALTRNGVTTQPVYNGWGTPVAVSSISKHPKESFDFIAQLHSIESQKRRALIGHIPVNRKLGDWFEAGNPQLGKFATLAAPYELRNFPDFAQTAQVDKVVQEAIQQALLGMKTPKEALDWGQAELVRILK